MSQCPVAHGVDLLGAETVLNPYTTFAELREAGPVFFMPGLDHYIVTRYDDIEKILLDRETWSASNASSPLNVPCEEAQAILANGYKRVPTLNNADAPRHGAMRKTVLQVMTPRRLNALEGPLRAYCANLVQEIKNESVIDFVERIAFPFPGYAAFTLLGFPPEDTEMLKEWSANRIVFTYGRLEKQRQIEIAHEIVAFWQYSEAHVAKRRDEPADDLTSDLLGVARQKPDQVNEFDIVNMVYSMALAGHETTCNTIGNGLRALLSNPSEWRQIVDQPETIPNAVEEILRYDGPVLNHRRLARVDTRVGGVDIPAGAKVMMCFGSAAHDPAHFDNPDAFDVDRENAELHLAFGKGAHLCLGAALGRLEVRLVLELLREHTPNMALVPDQKFEYSPNALFRGLKSLMVAPGGLA
jgi:cytochrome P450